MPGEAPQALPLTAEPWEGTGREGNAGAGSVGVQYLPCLQPYS